MTMDAFTGRDPTRPVAPAFRKLSDVADRTTRHAMSAGLLSDPKMVEKLKKGPRHGRTA